MDGVRLRSVFLSEPQGEQVPKDSDSTRTKRLLRLLTLRQTRRSRQGTSCDVTVLHFPFMDETL